MKAFFCFLEDLGASALGRDHSTTEDRAFSMLVISMLVIFLVITLLGLGFMLSTVMGWMILGCIVAFCILIWATSWAFYRVGKIGKVFCDKLEQLKAVEAMTAKCDKKDS